MVENAKGHYVKMHRRTICRDNACRKATCRIMHNEGAEGLLNKNPLISSPSCRSLTCLTGAKGRHSNTRQTVIFVHFPVVTCGVFDLTAGRLYDMA